MEINKNNLKEYGLLIGTILGYITIAVGVIMTIILLRTVFSGEII